MQVYELRTRLMTKGVFPAIRTQNEVIRKRLYLIRFSQARTIFQRLSMSDYRPNGAIWRYMVRLCARPQTRQVLSEPAQTV